MNDTQGAGDADGMDRAVTDALRIALMTAARAGEQLARRYAQQQREVRQAEDARVRDHEMCLNAARAAARAQLAPVAREDWWAAAGPQMIAQAHGTATAWRGLDREAAASLERIRTEVRQRYGIDLPAATPVPGDGAARVEELTAGAVLAGAARAETGSTIPGGPAHDSEERRRQLVEELAGNPDREAVSARLLADRHQGTPPEAAVALRPREMKPARKAPAAVRDMDRGMAGP